VQYLPQSRSLWLTSLALKTQSSRGEKANVLIYPSSLHQGNNSHPPFPSSRFRIWNPPKQNSLFQGLQRCNISSSSHESVKIFDSNDNEKSRADGSKSENTQIDYKKKMTMIFTCNVCTTRSAKTFHKFTYQRGVVIVRCEACKTLHLVADHLGWFEGAQKTIEEILAAKGENVLRITDKNTAVDPNTLEILPENLGHALPSHVVVSSSPSKKK
jgi:protein import protein ZIM17